MAPGRTPTRSPLTTPTTVTGIAVTGTTASATVTWQPVPGAVSYTVTRSTPYNAPSASFPGLSTTTWKDLGPQSIGFTNAGVYGYQVAAVLGNGTTVSGQASWTRPNPTCTAPPPNQPMQAVLAPPSIPPTFRTFGPFPTGAVFSWSLNTPRQPEVLSYVVERAPAGTNAWTVAATTCGGPSPITLVSAIPGVPVYYFIDASGGIVPNTTYAYRLTAVAADGETGASVTTWTAPSAAAFQWLPPTVAGSTVTLHLKYQSLAASPPVVPTLIKVTAPYGLSRNFGGVTCGSLQGCALVITNVPTGQSHTFTATATWEFNISLSGPQTAQRIPVSTSSPFTTTVAVP